MTPALQAVDVRARLTPAERETASLAAGGRTNKEIARQLVLSSRTVENRLQRVYVKLGISGRMEHHRRAGKPSLNAVARRPLTQPPRSPRPWPAGGATRALATGTRFGVVPPG